MVQDHMYSELPHGALAVERRATGEVESRSRTLGDVDKESAAGPMMTTDGIELPTVDTLTTEKATRLDWTPLTVSVMLTATTTSKVGGTTVVSNVNDEPVEVYCELAANAASAS